MKRGVDDPLLLQMYGIPGAVKQQKTEERTLDDVGFAFVQKCIEVLESRGESTGCLLVKINL